MRGHDHVYEGTQVMPSVEWNSDGVNWLPGFRSFRFELQGPCSAFAPWRVRIRYTQAFALPAHNQKLVLRHVANGYAPKLIVN